MIWVTSDHHFGHKNIIRYCNRPFATSDEMNKEMVKRWNEKVKKEDLVIHLGDFAFKGRAKEFREQLNGTILLIEGNHDSKTNEGFIKVQGNLIIGNKIFSHRPLERIPKGFFNIHGHIHDKQSYHGINLSVEHTDYYPVRLEEIKYEK